MVPVKPLTGVGVMVVLTVFPAMRVKLEAPDAKVKVGATTVRVIGVVMTVGPEVPVTLTV